MNHLQRLHGLLFFMTSLCLLAAAVQTQQAIGPKAQPKVDMSRTFERVAEGMKWHMLEIARAERYGGSPFYPGN